MLCRRLPTGKIKKLPVPVYKLTLIAALTINTFYLNANLSFLEKEWLWIRFSTLL